MPRRPKPFAVNRVRVHAIRYRASDGRWYWRATAADGRGGRVDVWMGWATRDEAGEAVLATLTGRDNPEGPGTVERLLECWTGAREERRDLRPRTIQSAEEAARRLVTYGLADVAVERVDRRALEGHRDRALAAGVAPATVQRDLKHLRTAWRWAMEIEGGPSRMLPRVRVHRVTPVRSRYTPTADEVGLLLEGVTPAVYRGLVLLAATGARVGEIVGLTWSGVPLDCTRIHVEGKTGPRWVTLPAAVGAEIRSWERGAPDERVVGVTSQRIGVVLAERSAELGLPRVTPTAIRRHVVDALYRTGRIDAAGAQLGHSPQTALTHYRRVTEEDRAAAVAAADLGVVHSLAQRLAQRREDALPRRADGTPKGRTAPDET